MRQPIKQKLKHTKIICYFLKKLKYVIYIDDLNEYKWQTLSNNFNFSETNNSFNLENNVIDFRIFFSLLLFFSYYKHIYILNKRIIILNFFLFNSNIYLLFFFLHYIYN